MKTAAPLPWFILLAGVIVVVGSGGAAAEERLPAGLAEARRFWAFQPVHDPALPVVGLPGSVLLRVAEEEGLATVAEGFADRGYRADGGLVPRTEPGAVLEDVDVVTERVVRMVVEGVVVATDGGLVAVPARTVCTHGDTPGSVAMAREARAALERAGVRIAAFVGSWS